MTSRWTGWVVVACLAAAVPARAQYLPVSGPTPAPEPIPYSPGSIGAQPPGPCPPAAAPSPLALPSNLDNAFMKPPKNDDFNCLYFGFEYLLWWIKSDPTDGPYVTTSTAPDFTGNFGALRQPTTVGLTAANNRINYPGASGGRFTFGAAPSWFLPIELSIFAVSTTHYERIASDGLGNPLIARPAFGVDLNRDNIPGFLSIFPTTKNQQIVYLASFPDLARGGVKTVATSTLWGLNADFFADPLLGDFQAGGMSLDVTFGYRYLNLSENLNITSSIQSIDPLFTVNFGGQQFGPNNIAVVTDKFTTRNTFNGGQLGLRGSYAVGPFIMNLKGNVAIGKTYQTVTINGVSTLFRDQDFPIPLQGGILALPSNSGRFTHDAWSVVPEGAVNLELPVANWLRLWVGYNVLYWNSVVRPASQVTRSIDTRQVPTDVDYSPNINLGSTQPTFLFHRSDFWAQGLTAGFAITY